jgi:hypothetical protein
MKKHYTAEEIISSLDHIQKASPSPYLYAKIQSKMRQESNSPEAYFFRFITNPAFALAVAFVFILMHGYLLMNRNENASNGEDMGGLIASEYVQHTVNPYEINDIP